jgi:small subunit ribosomal protein S9
MATTRRVNESNTRAKRFYATGRRKTAAARVWVSEGTGRLTINGRDADAYLCRPFLTMLVKQPLALLEREGAIDVRATVRGGGLSGQAGAVRHGIARALTVLDAELRSPLKAAGFLTRDPRAKERKKFGQRAARARFQFSKR